MHIEINASFKKLKLRKLLCYKVCNNEKTKDHTKIEQERTQTCCLSGYIFLLVSVSIQSAKKSNFSK